MLGVGVSSNIRDHFLGEHVPQRKEYIGAEDQQDRERERGHGWARVIRTMSRAIHFDFPFSLRRVKRARFVLANMHGANRRARAE
jgi:hypothetical protein